VAGVATLQPAGRIRPAKSLAQFFQAPRFPLWTAVQQHWLLLSLVDLSAAAALRRKQRYF